MAWPNNFNSFWETMYGPENHPSRGAGVDHAPPPPPELPPFMNPEFWNRWSTGPPGAESWGHGPHGRHAHRWGGRGGGRGGGGRGGGRPHWGRGGEDGPANGGSDNDEAFPPEYISDDEVAYATAAAEFADDKKKQDVDTEADTAKGKEGSPDTMMRDENVEDPPEEVPDENEDRRQRRGGGGRHGRHGGKGFRGAGAGPGGRHGGFGPHRRGGGRRGFDHQGPPPFGPFFGGMFGGPRRPHGRHSHRHGPPPPFFEAFFGGGGGVDAAASDGEHPTPPFHGRHHSHGRGRHGHPRGPPAPGAEGPFDFRGMMGALANHPYAHNLRQFLEQQQQQQDANNNNVDREGTPDSDMDVSITPPLDLFDHPDRWVLHIAVPGAKKEDVGVNWDADRSVLSVSGVVYRPGDEEFQKGLLSAERSVGLFSREVTLPPAEKSESKEEVDSEGILAKMEDGVLIVTVPKVEKDWTEVKRVEIN